MWPTAILIVVLGMTHAWGGIPFGGDDRGFVPPDRNTLGCEFGIATNVGRLIRAVTRCHVRSANAGLKGNVFDEEACESAGRARYDRANSTLTGCPPCLDTGAVADAEVGRLDGLAAPLVYCDAASGRPLADGDDGGFVPPSRAAAKCQNLVTRQIALLAERLVGCHKKLAAAALESGVPDQAAEDACEAAALAKYTGVVGRPSHCPTCLIPVLGALGAGIVGSVNVNGGDVYCASPGGAFLAP